MPDVGGRGNSNCVDRSHATCISTRPPRSPSWRGPTSNSWPSRLRSAAAGIATQRAVGRSPLELALSEAYRSTSREALALWADEQFTHHDPIRRRVAEEVDRFLSSQEPGGFRAWVEAANAVRRSRHRRRRRRGRGADVPRREGPGVAARGGGRRRGRPHPAQLGRVAGAACRGGPAVLRRHHAGSRPTGDHPRRDRGVASPTRPSPWLEAVEATIADDRPVAPPPELIRRRIAATRSQSCGRGVRHVARAARVGELTICSDFVLRSLLERPPTDVDELAERLGVTPLAAAKLQTTTEWSFELDDDRCVIRGHLALASIAIDHTPLATLGDRRECQGRDRSADRDPGGNRRPGSPTSCTTWGRCGAVGTDRPVPTRGVRRAAPVPPDWCASADELRRVVDIDVGRGDVEVTCNDHRIVG